jgi:hypothetical protein
MKFKQIPITIEEYNKKMDKFTKRFKNKPIEDCLIALLDESCKYHIVDANKMIPKRVWKGKHDSKRKKAVD